MLPVLALVLAALILAPLGAQAADLVVWWDQGYNPEEDAAVREVIAAFEQESGKQVELVFHPQDEHPGKLVAALEAGRPPDFAFGWLVTTYAPKWALEDRLVDLSEAVGHFSDLFDPAQLDRATLLNARTDERGLYGLPIGYVTNHLHVWKSLLEQAGFVLDDIPKEWEAFWSFWCDQVQPAVRKALGRDDIWGVALSMSTEPDDTVDQFFQFVAAYNADYVTPDGELVIDDPEIRRKLIKAIDSYTAVYRKGCSPPNSANWHHSSDNNKAFVAQSVVMTPNYSLSTINALKSERPDDYYENTATIEWPLGPSGEPFPIPGLVSQRGGLQGWPQCGHGQGVRPLPRGRRLADALSRLLGRAHAAVDPGAPPAAVLARPERSASHGRGDASPVAPSGARLTLLPRAIWATTRSITSASGPRRSTASPPRASAPSRRSTRRSRGSSRS